MSNWKKSTSQFKIHPKMLLKITPSKEIKSLFKPSLNQKSTKLKRFWISINRRKKRKSLINYWSLWVPLPTQESESIPWILSNTLINLSSNQSLKRLPWKSSTWKIKTTFKKMKLKSQSQLSNRNWESNLSKDQETFITLK